jgi:hypothetical protein
MQMTEETRKEIYHDLAELMLAALEEGVMTTEESEDSSAFILEKLDAVQNGDQLISFLEELKNKWAVYENVYTGVKSKYAQSTDTQKIEEIQSKLQQLAT